MQGIFYNQFSSSYIPEILHEIYRDKVYTPFIEDRKDLIVLDVGANIGLFSQYVSPFSKQVYAVEPSNIHTRSLNEMVKFNKLSNVITIKKALSNKNGTATFYHNTNETMFSLDERVKDTEEKEEVETITLDKLLKDFNIEKVDFMKLDVEGSEGKIIGSREFEEACKKIETIVFEYHSWSGFNPFQLVNNLKDYGYTVNKLGTQANLYSATRL